MEQGGSGEWTASKCQRSLNKRRLSIKDDSPTFSIRGTSIFGQSKCLTLRDVGESLWLIFNSKFIILINHIYLKPHMQLYSVLVKLLFFSHFLTMSFRFFTCISTFRATLGSSNAVFYVHRFYIHMSLKIQ